MYREPHTPDGDRRLTGAERLMLRRKMRGEWVKLGVVQLLAPLLLSLPILILVSASYRVYGCRRIRRVVAIALLA